MGRLIDTEPHAGRRPDSPQGPAPHTEASNLVSFMLERPVVGSWRLLGLTASELLTSEDEDRPPLLDDSEDDESSSSEEGEDMCDDGGGDVPIARAPPADAPPGARPSLLRPNALFQRHRQQRPAAARAVTVGAVPQAMRAAAPGDAAPPPLETALEGVASRLSRAIAAHGSQLSSNPALLQALQEASFLLSSSLLQLRGGGGSSAFQ
eukprot:scaffold11.g3943.t1